MPGPDLTPDELAKLQVTFVTLSTKIRDTLEIEISRDLVAQDGAYIRPDDNEDHVWVLDGRFDLHALAGLITRRLLQDLDFELVITNAS